MCTAISYQTNDHYFGRNLDLEYSYNESVVVTPRNFPLHFRKADTISSHYAMIGVAIISEGYPLYYDATNEKGLSIAGLNFPGNAVYQKYRNGKQNITPFEFIPWILAQCAGVDEALPLIQEINFLDVPFGNDYPLTPLHWMIADNERSITVEPLRSGVKIHENPIGVLTNNPPFEYHMQHLADYLNLTRNEPENHFAPAVNLPRYSRGMGAMGLPGDLSSSSRFIRAAFTLHNSVCDGSDPASINQFFHILGSVSQVKGCVRIGSEYEKTVYSSCCNTGRGIYYYTTYENQQITGIDMHCENLYQTDLISYPLIFQPQIKVVNTKS